ncbi:MAG TPA: hypothetical protein VGL93_17225 [Streptosporangiaceae bacterium]|jgi:hypothetical protein
MASTELDVQHITTICDRTADRTGITGFTITDRPAVVHVRAPSTEAAGIFRAALSRVGYTVDRPLYFGRRDELTIRGWNNRGLTTRITALRDEINRLDATRRETAATAIDRLTTGRTTPDDALSDVIRELRDRVEHHTGLIAPTNPRTRPSDPDTVRLLRTARRLEQHITERIHRHAITADVAVHRYARYRPHTTHDLARAAAIHDAHLTARPKSPTSNPAPHTPGTDATPRAEAAASVAARAFPTTPHDATTADSGIADRATPPTPSTSDIKRANR